MVQFILSDFICGASGGKLDFVDLFRFTAQKPVIVLPFSLRMKQMGRSVSASVE